MPKSPFFGYFLVCAKFKRNFNSANAKLKVLWSQQNYSTQKADFIKITFGSYFTTPTETRWNSYFDSITDFLKKYESIQDQATLTNLAFKIGFQPFKEAEMDFLKDDPCVPVLTHSCENRREPV